MLRPLPLRSRLDEGWGKGAVNKVVRATSKSLFDKTLPYTRQLLRLLEISVREDLRLGGEALPTWVVATNEFSSEGDCCTIEHIVAQDALTSGKLQERAPRASFPRATLRALTTIVV